MSDDKKENPVNTDTPVNVDPQWFVWVPRSIAIAGLTPNSIQEALRMYFQPIKHEDPHLDFYTMYKREATEHDTEYVRKYNEDLNATLIFVSFRRLLDRHLVLTSLRPVCSPSLARLSSSVASQSSSRIPASGQKPTFIQSFSASTAPSPPTNTSQLLPRGAVPLQRL